MPNLRMCPLFDSTLGYYQHENVLLLSNNEQPIKMDHGGGYKVKLGCKVELPNQENENWKRHVIWKLRASLKPRIFLWLVLKNKVLTWGNLQKRSWQGPRYYFICKESTELRPPFPILPFYKRSLGSSEEYL